MKDIFKIEKGAEVVYTGTVAKLRQIVGLKKLRVVDVIPPREGNRERVIVETQNFDTFAHPNWTFTVLLASLTKVV